MIVIYERFNQCFKDIATLNSAPSTFFIVTQTFNRLTFISIYGKCTLTRNLVSLRNRLFI